MNPRNPSPSDAHLHQKTITMADSQAEQPPSKVSSADKSSVSPIAICIPLKVDAFVLNDAVCNSGKAFVAPFSLPDYSSLEPGTRLQHDAIPHLDLRAAFPASINSRLTDIDSGKARIDRLGVYLHWTVPRTFRTGMTATSKKGMDQLKKHADLTGLPTTDKNTQDEFGTQVCAKHSQR
jgi:hypothetical protein